MKRKLLSVAVASAFLAPAAALAQSSTVQVYGTVLVNYNLVDYGNGRVNNDMLNSHDANLGFKGEEQLGGGLSAWFQCESTLDVTGVTLGGWCGRNSAFGLKGNFGNVFAGIWDMPMKTAMANFRPFSTSGAFGMSSVLWNTSGSDVGNGPAGVPAANVTSFTRRQTNLLTYATPNWAGFQGSVAFSTPNEATAQVNATTAKKARLWGIGGTYTNGPFMVGAGYERHTNYNPGLTATYTGGDDNSWDVGIAYTFAGVFKLSAIYTDTKYNNITPGTSLSDRSWGVYGDWAIAGPHRLRAEWNRQQSTSGNFGGAVVAGACTNAAVGQWTANCGQGGTGANLYGLQYAYAFSKRTELNFGYARLNNDANSAQALVTLGKGTAGQNQSAWVFGAKHTF